MGFKHRSGKVQLRRLTLSARVLVDQSAMHGPRRRQRQGLGQGAGQGPGGSRKTEGCSGGKNQQEMVR